MKTAARVGVVSSLIASVALSGASAVATFNVISAPPTYPCYSDVSSVDEGMAPRIDLPLSYEKLSTYANSNQELEMSLSRRTAQLESILDTALPENVIDVFGEYTTLAEAYSQSTLANPRTGDRTIAYGPRVSNMLGRVHGGITYLCGPPSDLPELIIIAAHEEMHQQGIHDEALASAFSFEILARMALDGDRMAELSLVSELTRGLRLIDDRPFTMISPLIGQPVPDGSQYTYWPSTIILRAMSQPHWRGEGTFEGIATYLSGTHNNPPVLAITQ